MKEHVLFFDASCPMCKRAVRKIQERDTRMIFEYFPLQSEMAKKSLSPKILSSDTLVLLENREKVWIRAKAIFRILHLLGGKYSTFSWLVHVPGLDFFYQLIAKNRHFFG